ncbi:peroxiredoxin [Marinomonas mediterranea]|jgi:Peroxiredoxin|uniref:Glutathione-dependent peroxiredoxin n=1 Tax=Marinomonas mediterranea (strain ATCC 700492 / JCM 21426 / NBRC 103028 / MMB-1) TaxID=717774 RepID=F2K128_MARM1|nr:peroxiredoxin [Marinomonas mediterranea]ADZ89878.1 Redoxin domain protein [Marinomonas mediterranea MMB-1]WCN07963.1 redoxin family protein [Marinomonas mediterranea]WCN12058.1 redoxin family protein [Marinomonas mediterranea]WCN16096.1 redoxin family protein [Marinomonas mediterranea MMB-1]
MSIQVDDMMPYGQFQVMGDNGPENVDVTEFFSGKRVIMFAVPGAFTPTCSISHLPGFVVHFDAFKEKCIDEIVCLSVNDVFVMDAWGKANNAENLVMAADGLAELTTSLGLELDISTAKLGIRSRRYAMLVDNGIVSNLWLEEPGEYKISSAEHVLSQI